MAASEIPAPEVFAQERVHTNRCLTLPPSPRGLFEEMVETLVAKRLARYEDADPFRLLAAKPLMWRPFLFVPPKPRHLDLECLLTHVRAPGGPVTTTLSGKHFEDRVPHRPEGAYLATCIDDGKNRVNCAPAESYTEIVRLGRSPLTVFEAIIYSIVFPPPPSRSDFHIAGSLYKRRFLPVLLFGHDGEKPRLTAIKDDVANPNRGIPSCKNPRVDAGAATGAFNGERFAA